MYLGFLNPQLMLGGLCSNFGTEFESFALQIHVAKISRSEHFVTGGFVGELDSVKNSHKQV